MNVGIDRIEFSTSKYFIKLQSLAKHRNVDYNKYYLGIGQERMSIFPNIEDIVTQAFCACEKVLKSYDITDIDLLIFASESTFDLSKSLGTYLHKFLKLKDSCRVFDIKQACYSLTAALQLSKSYIEANPNSKVLIVGSDILKYLPNSTGEPTQGGAAVAMIISKNPKILAIEPYSGIFTLEVMDFWRPANASEANFAGKLSAYNYLKSLSICVRKYFEVSRLSKGEIDYVCFHAPFSKMAQKALKQEFPDLDIFKSLIYNKIIGNSCSASLFICLISLFDYETALENKRIGLFSYGSGSVAEFFSGIVQNGYKNFLNSKKNQQMLDDRIELSFEEYEAICYGSNDFSLQKYHSSGKIFLKNIFNGQHIYEIKSEI